MLLLVVILAAVALWRLTSRMREPVYKERSLSEWVKRYQAQDTAAEATEAISQIGTNALPYLLQWVSYDSPGRLKSLVGKLPARLMPASARSWANGDYHRQKGNSAAFAFVALGNAAEPAIPELNSLMNDKTAPKAARNAVFALASIGEIALPTIVRQIANTNAPNRGIALRALVLFPALVTNSTFATSAVPVLVNCLADAQSSIRLSAADTLARLAEYDRSHVAAAVVELTNRLSPEYSLEIRHSAIRALGKYRGLATGAIPSLLITSRDTNAGIRAESFTALFQISPALSPGLLSNSSDERMVRANIPAYLIARLKSPNALVRAQAYDTLSIVAPWALTNFSTFTPPESSRPVLYR